MGKKAWLKKETNQHLQLAKTNLKISLLFLPLYLVIQILSYLYFKDSLFENGFWVIITPVIATLIILIPYLMTKRNDPNYTIYYFLHPTTFIKIAILISIPLLIGLYFYAQCRELGDLTGITCIKRIFTS